jgi:hypothetical protein
MEEVEEGYIGFITAKYFYDQIKEDGVGGTYGPRVLYYKCIDVSKIFKKFLMYK